MWQGLMQMIPQLPDFAGAGMNYGVGRLAAGDYEAQVRDLRRTAYQDMVFSLKKAGLNPVLAVGATPGAGGNAMAMMPHAGGGAPGVGSAIAANRMADIAGKKAPSEIDLNTARTGLTRETAFNEVYRRGGIMQEMEKNDAWIKNMLQQTSTSAMQAALYEAEAKKAGASEAEIRERTEQINKFGLPGQTWEGIVRQVLTDPKQIDAVLGPITNTANSYQGFKTWFNEAGSNTKVDYGR